MIDHAVSFEQPNVYIYSSRKQKLINVFDIYIIGYFLIVMNLYYQKRGGGGGTGGGNKGRYRDFTRLLNY